MATKVNKAREALAELFVKSLGEEKLPWNQPWVDKVPVFGSHQNPITGTRYRGVNAVILWAVAMEKNYCFRIWGIG